MKGRSIALALLLVLTAAPPAHAVVPGLVGPLQALLQLTLQLGTVVIGSAATTMRFPALRQWLAYKRRWILITVPMVVLLAVGIGVGLRHGPTLQGHGTIDTHARWSTFQGGFTRLGTVDGQVLPPSPHVRWLLPEQSAETFDASPAVVDGRLYIASATMQAFRIEGAIMCVDVASGNVLWRTPTTWPVFSSPVVARGRVYCGEGLHENKDARLYCMDAGTGQILWTISTASHTEGTPTLVTGADGTQVVFTAGEDGMYCADALTGHIQWHTTGLHADTSPAVVDGHVYVGTGYGHTRTMCLDLQTGQTRWEKPTELAAWAPPSVVGHQVWFGMGNGDFATSSPHPDGRVVCQSTDDGRELWRRELPDAILTALAVDGDRLVCGSRDGNVYCLRSTTGEVLWQQACGRPVDSSPVVAGGHVYVAGGDGNVRSLDETSGAIEWTMPGRNYPIDSSPTLAAGRLYVGAGPRIMSVGP